MRKEGYNQSFIVGLLLLLPLSAVQAQRDSTLSRTVIVENEYNPDIIDATKINVLPRMEEPAAVKAGVEYATALRPVSAWTYESMPSITPEWVEEGIKRGFLRAGYGSYGNVELKTGYLWDLTKDDRLRAGVSLDGMNGTLTSRNDEEWDARFYTTKLHLDYSHRFQKLALHLGGSFGSQVFNYMPVLDKALDKTDKQHTTTADFHIGLSSHSNPQSVQFRLQIGLEYFRLKYPLLTVDDDAEARTETILHTEGGLWKDWNDGQRIGFRFVVDNLFYSADKSYNFWKDDYTSLELNPFYEAKGDNWRLHAGAHVDWQSGEDSGMDFAPDVKMEFIFSDSYVLYLQALGGQELNDYRRFASFSPYWNLDGYFSPTYVPLNATLGFKASPMDGLWFDVFGGYRIIKDELSVHSCADKVYYAGFSQEDANTVYAGAELKYGYKDVFDVSMKGTFYSWDMDCANEGLYLSTKPKFELNFLAAAKIMEGLKVNVGFDYAQRRDYYKQEGYIYDLGNVCNLSLGAEYLFLRNLAVFGRIDNLLNKRYFYDSSYPTEELNVILGLSWKF